MNRDKELRAWMRYALAMLREESPVAAAPREQVSA